MRGCAPVSSVFTGIGLPPLVQAPAVENERLTAFTLPGSGLNWIACGCQEGKLVCGGRQHTLVLAVTHQVHVAHSATSTAPSTGALQRSQVPTVASAMLARALCVCAAQQRRRLARRPRRPPGSLGGPAPPLTVGLALWQPIRGCSVAVGRLCGLLAAENRALGAWHPGALAPVLGSAATY